MKQYNVHLGDRDRMSEDLKPVRRRSWFYLIGGAFATIFGINQMMKSSFIDGKVDTTEELQRSIDRSRLIESMEEQEEQ